MRTLRPVFLAIGTFLLIGRAFCAVKVGDPAAPIALDALIPAQPVENASLAALSGKAVVLEFWATWCGPCVAAIPHLNELADRFAGRPIQFLSVTDEEASVIEPFLKARPIHGWVGFDRARRMWNAYGFDGIPFTVLIDAGGKVAGITHPNGLTPEVLEDLLAGRPLKVSAPIPVDMSIPRASVENGPAPLLDIIVRPSSTTNPAVKSGPGIHQWKAWRLRDLLSTVYDVSESFVEGDAADDPTRYDVSVIGPRKQDEALRKTLPALLAVAFQVDVRRETRQKNGWVLSAPHGKPELFKEAASPGRSTTWGNGQIRVVGGTLEQLAGMAQSMLDKPVVDRTGIAGRFDFDLDYDQSRPESFLDALRKCGFALEPASLPIDYLVVSKAKESR